MSEHEDDELHHDHMHLDYHGGHVHRSTKKLKRAMSIGPVVEEPHIKFPSCRLVLMLMAFFAFLNIYCLRVNLSVALVAMVNSTYIRELEGDHHDGDHHGNATNETNIDPDAEVPCPEITKKAAVDSGTFNWDTNKQGIILAAFFYGYITTQILGGVLAQRYGGKRLLLFGIGWTAVLTILTPVLTIYGDFPALVATRVLEGIGEGVTYPSMHAMLSKWAPPLERSKMVTSVYAGAQIGTVLAMPISGLLSDYAWESVFYVFGALGLVWSVMWIFLTYDTPDTHPRIDPAERDYIQASQGLLLSKKGSLQTPWLSIAKSLPVYATAVAHFCNNWGYYTLLTCLPAYLKYILKFDIKSNGALSGVPYLMMWMAMIASGLGADHLRTKRILSTTGVRKLFTAVGFLGPAACLVGTGYVECNAAAAVALIVIAVGLSGLSMAGWGVNHLDLAPPYAGTLMGITNMIATIPGFLGPSIVGVFTYKNQTRKAWRNVFFVSAAVYVFGTVFYCIFGSGRKQAWATPAPTADKDRGDRGDEKPATRGTKL